MIEWSEVPDDVIDYITMQVVVPLQKKERKEKTISEHRKDKNVYKTPNHFERSVYTYFNMFLVSKQFNKAAAKMDFDWFALAGSPFGNYYTFRCEIEQERKRQEDGLDSEAKEELARRGLPFIGETPKKMLRTLVCCDNGLPLIREEIDSFIRKHKLEYKSKGVGRRYDPLTRGVRKLKTIKVQPLSLDTHFKGILKKHEVLNKKRLDVTNALKVYADKVARKPV